MKENTRLNVMRATALFSAFTWLVPLAAPVFTVREARAGVNQSLDPLNIDATKLKSVDISCDNVCNMMIKGGTDYRGQSGVRGVNSGLANQSLDEDGSPWTVADDQWCAAHGSITDPAAGPGPSGTPLPNTSCNVPIITSGPGADRAPSSNAFRGMTQCKINNRKLLHCKFKNTQVEQQCMAYLAAHDGAAFDWTMFALDLSATATCTAACFSGGSFEPACAAVGGAAGTLELIFTIAQNNSAVGSILKGTLAAASIGTSVGSIAGYNDLAGKANQGSGKFKDKASCAAAALFAITAGVRVYDIANMDSTAHHACKAVKDLASNATPQAGGPGSGSDINFGNYSPANGTGGGPGQNGSGGGTGNTPIGSSDPNSNNDPTRGGLSCVGNTGTQNCTSSSATDGGILADSGLDKPMAQQASHLDLPALKSQLASGGVGSVMGGALGSDSGDFGKGLAALAQAAYENPNIAGISTGSGVLSSGGGGGAGTGGKSGGDNPFGGLFGNMGAKDNGARGPSSTQFGRTQPVDIWHTGTTQNIFEIISEKVSKVAHRVGAK